MSPSYDMRSHLVNGITLFGVDARNDSVDSGYMMTKGELLTALEARGVKNVEIERVLGLPSSRVAEIRRKTGKTRELSYDEGVKLVRAFLPESDPRVDPLPPQMLRLVVGHIAHRLGTPLPEELLADLAEDLRVFSEYAADPKVRGSVEAAEGFFRAMEFLRPSPEEEVPQGSDRAPKR